jgi:putative methionine-R-sulfoxide reductase with GAF domain
MTSRDYTPLLAAAANDLPPDRDAAMRRAVQLLWTAFANNPISWVGFYTMEKGAHEMILVCREPKPACSPLGLQGMCGRCYLERRPILLNDARELPPTNYIACDPKDLSEAVIPLIDESGACYGVLDADSYSPGAFNDADIAGMSKLVEVLGLSRPITAPTLRL